MKTDHLKYLILTISILLTLGINLYAENTSDTEHFNTISKIKSRGVLRVGVSPFVPWTMKDKKGSLSGYEIDMASKMADDMGVKLELVNFHFKDVISGLIENKYDIIMAGLYLTPQRALIINLSEPEAYSQVNILANTKHTNLRTIEHFNKKGISIGAVAGTVYVDLAKTNFPNATLKAFNEEADMLSAIVQGEIDALIAIDQVIDLTLKNHPEKVFKPSETPIAVFGESFGIRQGDPDFLNFLNTWIRFYQDNGWLKQRRDYWFGNE